MHLAVLGFSAISWLALPREERAWDLEVCLNATGVVPSGRTLTGQLCGELCKGIIKLYVVRESGVLRTLASVSYGL